MSNGEIFNLAFYGGLGLGLAAISCIYLAKCLDMMENVGKNLYEVLKLYHEHKQAQKAQDKAVQDAG